MATKVLLTHRFFWPDTAPYAVLLRSIGEELAEVGCEVHIMSSRPSYRQGVNAPGREILGRLRVRRCPVVPGRRSNPGIRFLNTAIYCVSLFWHVLWTRANIVSASTFPPVLAAWLASLAARLTGGRFIYHMQDVHPEVSQYTGGRLGRGVIAHALRKLDNQTIRRAAAIVVLSEDMADTIKARKLGPLPVHIINNFILEDFDRPEVAAPPRLRKVPGRRRIIFAGNLGRFQNLPLLTRGVVRYLDRSPDTDLLLLGDGPAEEELRSLWNGHPGVIFGPFLPFPQARVLIAESDVGLVSLRPDMYRVAFPSKVFTYWGLGIPVLALVEPESALAMEVIQNSLGAIPERASPEAIELSVERCFKVSQDRRTIKEWHDNNACPAVVLAQWRALIGSLS